MIVFNPYPKEKRKNNKRPGIYKFLIEDIFEKRTNRGEPAIKMSLWIAELGTSISYQLGINDTEISHYYLEQFLRCIGKEYPENGVLDVLSLKNLEGIANFEINSVYASLVLEEFLIVKPKEPFDSEVTLPYLMQHDHRYDLNPYFDIKKWKSPPSPTCSP